MGAPTARPFRVIRGGAVRGKPRAGALRGAYPAPMTWGPAAPGRAPHPPASPHREASAYQRYQRPRQPPPPSADRMTKPKRMLLPRSYKHMTFEFSQRRQDAARMRGVSARRGKGSPGRAIQRAGDARRYRLVSVRVNVDCESRLTGAVQRKGPQQGAQHGPASSPFKGREATPRTTLTSRR